MTFKAYTTAAMNKLT